MPRPQCDPNTTRVSASLDLRTYAQLLALARRNGLSDSAVVRLAIKELMATNKPDEVVPLARSDGGHMRVHKSWRWRAIKSQTLTLLLSHSIWLFLGMATASAQTSTSGPQSFLSEDFWQKVTIAILAAIFAFVSSYLILRATDRRKPRAQISYSIYTDRALTPFNEELRRDMKVLFREMVVANLFQVKCIVRNTGNMVIRKEEIRFSFAETAKILDAEFPEPEAEIGFVADAEFDKARTDRKIAIAFFSKQRELAFGFVVDGEQPQLKLYEKNETEDVDFVAGELRQIRDDEDIIKRFLLTFALFILLPPVLGHIIPIGGLSEIASASMEIVLLAFILPLLPRASAILTHRVLRPRNGNEGLEISASNRAMAAGRDIIIQSRDVDALTGPDVALREPTDRGDDTGGRDTTG